MTYGMDDSPALVEIVTARKGAETQTTFAARLGISQSEVSKFLAGQRGLSPKIAAALIRAYPDLERRVIRELLDFDGQPDDSSNARAGLAAPAPNATALSAASH